MSIAFVVNLSVGTWTHLQARLCGGFFVDWGVLSHWWHPACKPLCLRPCGTGGARKLDSNKQGHVFYRAQPKPWIGLSIMLHAPSRKALFRGLASLPDLLAYLIFYLSRMV